MRAAPQGLIRIKIYSYNFEKSSIETHPSLFPSFQQDLSLVNILFNNFKKFFFYNFMLAFILTDERHIYNIFSNKYKHIRIMVVFANPQNRSRYSHGEVLYHEPSLQKLAETKEKEQKQLQRMKTAYRDEITYMRGRLAPRARQIQIRLLEHSTIDITNISQHYLGFFTNSLPLPGAIWECQLLLDLMNKYNKADDFDVVKALKEKDWDRRLEFDQVRKEKMKQKKAKIKTQRFQEEYRTELLKNRSKMPKKTHSAHLKRKIFSHSIMSR